MTGLRLLGLDLAERGKVRQQRLRHAKPPPEGRGFACRFDESRRETAGLDPQTRLCGPKPEPAGERFNRMICRARSMNGHRFDLRPRQRGYRLSAEGGITCAALSGDGLARGLDPDICTLLGPGVGEVGMGQGLGFILEQQDNVPCFGLLPQELESHTRPLNRFGDLPAFETVTGAPPSEAPFFLSTTLSRDLEMRTPVRFSISSCRRGNVQFGRFSTGHVNTSVATETAKSPLIGARPGGGDARSASTPPSLNQTRQRRTLSAPTP